MPYATANGIRIAYETFGSGSAPTLLLIAGNGAPLLFWETAFCEMLAETGLHVIRFDNRDCGLSTKFDEAGVPDIMAAFTSAIQGRPVKAAYSLDEMADDCLGLLDALGIEKAHVCGASMGGMIAQVVACRHPNRVLSLTSIMANTGNLDAPQGRPEALAAVLAPAPDQRDAWIQHYMDVWRKLWSPGFPFDETRARSFMEQSYDRSYCPQGAARQNVAVIACGDRRPALSRVTIPALVIHGASDPLIPVEAGKETARAIPGAKLLVIDGMGHDMPEEVWPEIVTAISANIRRAASAPFIMPAP